MVKKESSKRKIIKDSVLNIMATLVFTISTQLFIYPILAKTLSAGEFGTLLTVIGLINAFGVIFGGSLNNIRLINSTENNYSNNQYSSIMYRAIIVNTIIIITSLLFFLSQINLQKILILTITCNLIFLRSYLTVFYRINMNYKRIFSHMLVTSFGYILGLFLYVLLKEWTIIFFIGEMVSVVYLKITIKIYDKNEKNFKDTKKLEKDYTNLVLSNSISNIMLYLDRLLLNPLLGAMNVGIFFSASLFGKMLGIILQPLSGVVLTYISRKNELSKQNIYRMLFFISGFSGLLLFFISIYATPIFIRIFYPDFVNEIKNYYIIANLGSIVLIMSNLLQPLTLKYCNLEWQILIQGVYGFLYVFLGIVLTIRFGLNGFIYAVLISNLSRYILINLLLNFKLKEK